MQELLKAIAHFQLPDIVTITQTITDTQRKNALRQLSEMDPYNISRPRGFAQDLELWEYYNKVSNYFYYAILLCLRETADFKQLKLRTIIYIKSRLGKEELEPYRPLIQPYLPPFWKEMDAYFDANREEGNFFKWCWDCYEKGWIDYQEEDFLRELVEVPWQSRWDITMDVAYLKAHPKVFDLLYLITTKELKVLDAASWKNQQGQRGTGSPANYWTEVFTILIEEGYPISKDFVQQLYASLLNPWKKPHLDWHCRLLRLFNPSEEEVLAAQHTLFAVLGTGIASVIKFAMEQIATIAQHPAFDKDGFVSQLPLCFTVPKQPKTLLLGLDLLTQCFKAKHPTDPAYREQLAVLFTQPDVKVQEKVAELLTTYFNQEGLPEVIAPYRNYLKGKAQDLLATLSPSENSENSENSKNSHTSHTALTLTPVPCPLTPEDLLFLLGDCIREGTAETIDLFFEGLVQLQDRLPENLKEQLAPYIKQLGSYSVSGRQVKAMLLLLRGWAEDKAIETPPKEWQPYIKKARELEKSEDKKDQQEGAWLWCVFSTHKELLYFFNKIKTTISKLKNGDRLPFLATPSVKPFYIDADTLANRLLIYQAAGKEPELDDIVVAANRLLSSTITPEAKDKVRTLTGKYARAMAYLFELTDVITPEEEILPLWTQMTRIKHPNAIFEEFENTSANDYPAVVKPFYIHSYTIDDCKFHLENDYNYYGFNKEKALPYNFYNAGNYDKLHSSTFKYFMSLNPQYLDALLCRYVPYWVRINDATIYEDLNKITTFLLANNLRIYQSGWLFMGIAFLHDKKETRDLATEYILRAISRDEDLSYLQHFLADILAQKLTPINRFMEFLDIPTRDPKIKAFQKAVVEAYLPLAEQLDKKPTNHKKLADWRM